MRLILFGPPGVGKGTTSAMLVKDYKIPHISSGNIIREIASEKSESAKKVKPYLENGLLVPNEIITPVIKDRLKQDDCKNGFALDGFPRNVEQAEFLDKLLAKDCIEINYVINLIAKDKTIIGRLSGRRICKNCDAIYHLQNIPPKKEGICDKCGGVLIQREDDKPEVIKERIKQYQKETKPLIEYYAKENLLRNIDTDKPLDEIFSDIRAVLG